MILIRVLEVIRNRSGQNHLIHKSTPFKNKDNQGDKFAANDAFYRFISLHSAEMKILRDGAFGSAHVFEFDWHQSPLERTQIRRI